jgi:hypothetical protein
MKDLKRRNEIIFKLKKRGFTLQKIGDKYGICKQRAGQIVNSFLHPKIKKEKSIHSWSRLEGRDFTREKIRTRDNHTCQICGKVWEKGMRKFDVHHRDCKKEKSLQYDDYGKENYNLITLCHKCRLNLPEHRMSMALGRCA